MCHSSDAFCHESLHLCHPLIEPAKLPQQMDAQDQRCYIISEGELVIASRKKLYHC
jgi:hypothetical protein